MPTAEPDDTTKPSNLTNYICEDLKARIQSGEIGSGDLSLLALAEQYGVSVTPLRSAIRRLVDEGVLKKLPNRRLQVSTRISTTAAAPRRAVETPPTPRDWDEVLMREVMLASLHLKPAYLREDSLSRKLGIGRSILRHTLSRFAGAGLIEHIPRRGWLVHPLGVEDMEAYLVVREMLELKALKLARPRLDPEELRRIRDLSTGGEEEGRLSLDNSIHEYIIGKSGNRYIRQFFQQYVARYYTELFYFAAPETSVVEEMAQQHLGIIEALAERRWTKAEKLLAEHIAGQATVLFRLLEKERAIPGREQTSPTGIQFGIPGEDLWQAEAAEPEAPWSAGPREVESLPDGASDASDYSSIADIEKTPNLPSPRRRGA